MEFTNEMIQKAKQASSAEELLAMAKEEGVALAAEEAEKYFAFLQGGNELPDEALEAVAGGKGTGGETLPGVREICQHRGVL